MYGNCPYWDCPNRNELGYCKTTSCINPKYQYQEYITLDRTINYENYVDTGLEKVVYNDEKNLWKLHII